MPTIMIIAQVDPSFDNNVLLYFFSAMPQVLGTMLALIGAFYPSRSGSIKNAIKDTEEIVQKKIIDILEDRNLYNLRRRAIDIATSILPADGKEEAEWLYRPEVKELAFENDRKLLSEYNAGNIDLDQLKKIYTDFNSHFYESLSTFNDRKDILLKKFDPKYGKDLRSYLPTSEIREIKSLMFDTLRNINDYFQIRRSIKEVLIFNGMILLFFISSFLFLKSTSDSILLHNNFLRIGVVLASISAYSMVFYVYNVLSEKPQTSLLGLRFRERCKVLYNWILENMNTNQLVRNFYFFR